MAFLCPIRIPRRKRKKKDGENATKNGAPKGRTTGSNSVDSLMKVAEEEEDDDSDFEPRKMVVLYDFTPCIKDETPVKRNEHVKALYQENDWLYVVKGDGQEGFVPFTSCISEEEYSKRKEKAKTASLPKKNSTQDHLNVTLQDLKPAEFFKQNYGEYVVKFDFDAIDEDDISVRKGEIVVVLNKEDQDWFWVGKKSGKEGFIPKDFVTKIEQIASRNLAESGLRSRSSPNIAKDNPNISPHNLSVVPEPTGFQLSQQKDKRRSYHEVNNNVIHTPKSLNSPTYKLSTHPSPVIYANPFTVDSSPPRLSPSNTKVIPLSSTMSYSPNTTVSSQGTASTPVLPANPLSSMSDMESALPTSLSYVRPMSSTFRNSFYPNESPIYGSQNQNPLSAGTEQAQSSKGRISMLSQKRNLQMSQLGGTLASRSYSSMTKHEQVKFSPVVIDTATYTPQSSPIRTVHRKNSNDLLLNGQELVCTDTYIAQKGDELTVYKGDWIYADMKSRDFRGWIWAYSPSTKNQGFVPKYCLRPPATTPL